MKELTSYEKQTFESIKHVGKQGREFWFARELQVVLEYAEWRNFSNVIEKAIEACRNSDIDINYHFVEINKTIEMPKGAKKTIPEIALSRYACYLIVQNADPSKAVVAIGQTYFAVQTRKQEITEEQSENEKRLSIRRELTEHNKSLADAAALAGVVEPLDYAIFQNAGYKGLYGGLGVQDIHKRKGLKKSQKILDYMGSTELAANLFRATQTDEKIRREKITGIDNANQTHYEVGTKVRQTIKELGGTMPEDEPTPEKSVEQIAKEQIKELRERAKTKKLMLDE